MDFEIVFNLSSDRGSIKKFFSPGKEPQALTSWKILMWIDLEIDFRRPSGLHYLLINIYNLSLGYFLAHRL